MSDSTTHSRLHPGCDCDEHPGLKGTSESWNWEHSLKRPKRATTYLCHRCFNSWKPQSHSKVVQKCESSLVELLQVQFHCSPLPINTIFFLKESIFYNHSTAIKKKKKCLSVSLGELLFSRWFFQESKLFWGLVLPLKFPCIEKLVLQRTIEELLEMGESGSVAQEICVFSVVLLQVCQWNV